MATYKQKLALIKIMENRGNISKAMKEAGYTKATSKNPSNLTKSKGMRELVETLISGEDLATAHKNLFESKNINTKTKALNMLYKIKGLY